MPSLVDYFAVCGLSHDLDKEISEGISFSVTPPLSHSFACKILSRFPDKQLSWNSFDDGAVRTLCMPEGLMFKKNIAESLNAIFHTFLITREDGSHSYGNVLTFYEEVNDTQVLNVLESLQQKYSQKRRTSSSADEANCFSRDQDRLFAPKCLCFVTSQPFHEPFRVYLEQLYAVTVGKQAADLPVESYLYNLLFEVPMPSPGKSVSFSGPLGKLTCQRPSLNEFPLCDYSFKRFFELLGVRNAIKLLTCILLEHQVLVKSSDYERLMLVCHCSTMLLFPFSWPHVFVPFLPASQRGFLDAPVPYIMGLRVDNSSSANLNLPNVASLCTVDVDTGSVECPDELPVLPNKGKLILQITEKVQAHKIKCPDLPDLPSSPPTRAYRRPSIIDALKFVQELTEHIGPDNADLKKLLTEAALNNSHIPNLINIATRAGIKTPLSPTLSLDEGAYDLDDEEDSSLGEWDYEPDKSENEFATSIREVFANFFVEQFANYENFIIMPQQSYEQWQQNREQFQNFDKAAFISDQPANCREFYSAFLESSMFSSFIDEKIVTFWDPDKAGHNLSLFESRIESYHDSSGLAVPPTTPRSRNTSLSSDVGMDVTLEVITETAPLPHPLSKQCSTLVSPRTLKHTTSGTFPTLDEAFLKMSVTENSSKEHPAPLSRVREFRRGYNSDSKLLGDSPALVLRRTRRSGSGNGSGLFSSHSHAKFVSQLMRESRLRVKHMLGSSGDNESTIEENTHIAYLCDLLERIWGHGLKKRDSKSPLWAHLMAYGESVGVEEFSPTRGRVSPPHPAPLTSSMSSLAMHTTHPVFSAGAAVGADSPRTAQTLRAHFRRKKFQSPQLRARVEAILHPRPSTLLEDLSAVHQMRELKTDVGRARAWVRLALENKSLSRHLSKLLEHKELIIRRYREYAFIGTDEEREQFLYHLLTLTARDFSCFTTGFLSTAMTYRVLVVGEGKHFGLSTACLYVQLAGEAGEAGAVDIPRGEYQTTVTCNNLGPLTSLRLGHDNSGITPSLFVEMVLVHNLTTGQTYRFNCGHWFARSEEDGSVERFLVASRVPQTIAKSGKSGAMSALDVDSVLPPSPGRRRVAKKDQEETFSVNQLKFELKQAMDKIRTSALSKNKDSSQEMLMLIHGPSGFLSCMEQVFNFGFRSSRKFQKRLYPWDLLERVYEQLHSDPSAPSGDELRAPPSPDREAQCRQMFLNAVSRINANNSNIGKEEKAMRFFGLGLRDHYLHDWITLLSQSPITASLYEPLSFLCDPELLQNLLDALTLTVSLPIRLEPLFTQNL